MRKPVVVLGVVAGLLGAQGVAAQAAPEMAAGAAPEVSEAPPRVNSLEPGARALSFALPGFSTGTFAYTRMRSAERSITWEVRVQASHNTRNDGISNLSTTALGFAVGPVFRRYFEPERKVVPFFAQRYFVGYDYRHHHAEAEHRPESAFRQNSNAAFVGAGAAVGLEWFPVKQMSLRGETGLSGSLSYNFGDQEGDWAWHSEDGWGGSLSTFTAGLTVSLYLPRRER